VIQDLTDIFDERLKDKIVNAERKLHNGNLQMQEDETFPRYYTRFVATMAPPHLTFNDQIRLETPQRTHSRLYGRQMDIQKYSRSH